MTHNKTKLLFRGIHEVCRKRIDGGVSHVGYFDNAEDVFKAVERDAGYEAIWVSLNPLPRLPDGFTINILQPSPTRSTKESYTRRTALLIDCDPVRTNGQKKSNSTDSEKAASLAQAGAIRNFLSDQLQWPKPILVDSGNGTQARYAIDLPADQASEDLIRNLLAGLAAKFDNEQSHVDCGVFEANRVAKLPGTWARKAPESNGRPWRQSCILEVPERQIELPARAGQPRETIKELALEPVAALADSERSLPPARSTEVIDGVEMSQNDLSNMNGCGASSRSSMYRSWPSARVGSASLWTSSVLGNRSTAARLESLPHPCGMSGGTATVFDVCTANAPKERRGWFDFREAVDPEGAAKSDLTKAAGRCNALLDRPLLPGSVPGVPQSRAYLRRRPYACHFRRVSVGLG